MFKFRYLAEMEKGKHGSINGKDSTTSFPTVALRNFNAPENTRVFICCSLYQVPEYGMDKHNRKPHCHQIVLPGHPTKGQDHHYIQVFRDSYTAA